MSIDEYLIKYRLFDLIMRESPEARVIVKEFLIDFQKRLSRIGYVNMEQYGINERIIAEIDKRNLQ